mgnify:CR=1 FL=1|tara:strand:- start:69871 stop:70692 length:822 start_codon:yes stop_codon:yes gene_type:complete
MKKLILLSIAIFATSVATIAQEDSYNTKSHKAHLAIDSMNVDVMIIPASFKMYSSYFDKKMMDANTIKFEQLRDTILSSLASEIAAAFNDSVPSGVILESKTGYPEDMDFVYESIDYTFKPVPEPKKKESTLNKWKKKFNTKEPQPEPRKGTYMEGGQIVSNPETKPLYTNIKVLNSDFLYLLNKRYHASTFVFINQYEMAIPMDVNQVAIQGDNYPRIIKVHYTIVDVDGKELHSGLVTRNSSSFDDKLDYLIGTSFYQIGTSIMSQFSKGK